MEIKVSIGEIIDKFIILAIKKERIYDKEKSKHIMYEYYYLEEIIQNLHFDTTSIDYKELYEVNLLLWDIEDKIRDKDRKKEFDSEFVKLARNVYIFNDKRVEIKRKINLTYKSEIVEEKSYERY